MQLDQTRRAADGAELDPVKPAEAAAEQDGGPGVKALKELLAKGPPDPNAIVAIIDAHRSEHDALFALLHTTFGNAFVVKVQEEMDRLRVSVDRKEVVAGDPAAADDGYFIASAAERGARWRTEGGGFTGRIDSRGLDTTVTSGDTAVRARVDARDRSGTVGVTHEGETVAELAGAYRGSDDWRLGLRRPFTLDGGGTITPELRHEVTGGEARDLLSVGYRGARTSGELWAGRHDTGAFVGGVSGTHALDDRTTLSGRVDHDPLGTTVAGSATHRWDSGHLSLSGSDGPRGLNLGLSAEERPNDRLTLTGGLTHVQPEGGEGTTTLSLAERYRSAHLMHELSLSGSVGAEERLRATGSLDAKLAPHLYAGAFGRYEAERDKDATYAAGGSLTLTTSEKMALTLAGVLDQTGAFETRLQLDVFKKAVETVPELSEAKKKAIVSLFVSYTAGGGTPGMLDDRFGAPTFGRGTDLGGGTVMGGIKIRF
jgi:hypothetical protein